MPLPDRGERGWARAWLPVAAYATVIFWLSSHHGDGLPRWSIMHYDKVLHTLEYAALGLLLGRGLGAAPGRTGRIAAAVMLGFAYGVSDEFHQSFVAGRQGNDPGDLLADLVGSTLGVVSYALVWARRKAEVSS